MVRLLSFVLAAFVLSCTIIEDSDITSQKELDKLKLASIDIEQQLVNGSTATSTARVTSDKAVSISVAGGTIKRTIYMDWPALGANSKLKVKSGTSLAFRSYVSLLESGKPWTFYLFSSGSDSTILELYSFRYNSKGLLASLITRVPYVAGGPATTNDTLIYDTSGHLTGITRRFPANGTSAAISNTGTGGSSFYLAFFNFQGNKYARDCKQPECGGTWGGNYNVLSLSTNFPIGVMNLNASQKAYLDIQDFNNINQNLCNGAGSNCNAGWIDKYNLHPLMILKDQFSTIGDDYLFFYMVDWWNPNTGQQSSANEKLRMKFNYDF